MYSSSEIPLSTRIQKEEDFFSKRQLLSYSGLNKLLYSPGLYYNDYILQNRQETSEKYMIEGKLMHCLLFNKEDFDKNFIITPHDLPSDNALKLLNTLFTYYKELKKAASDFTKTAILPSGILSTYQNEILTILAEMNLYQSLKTDGQRLDKVLIDKNITYFEYLIKSEGRDVIDDEQLDAANKTVEKILNKPSLANLIGVNLDPMSNVKVHNEYTLVALLEKYPFDLKGIVDNMVIDHDSKIIRINDLKKTNKAIQNFEEAIKYYRYDIQAAIYYFLVRNTIAKEMTDYSIQFRFLVVDNMLQVAPYKISDETMKVWFDELRSKLDIAKYHFDNRNFELPYDFLQAEEKVL